MKKNSAAKKVTAKKAAAKKRVVKKTGKKRLLKSDAPGGDQKLPRKANI